MEGVGTHYTSSNRCKCALLRHQATTQVYDPRLCALSQINVCIGRWKHYC